MPLSLPNFLNSFHLFAFSYFCFFSRISMFLSFCLSVFLSSCLSVILGHLSSLEVDSDQIKACYDDSRDFVDGMDGIGIGWGGMGWLS